jgi:hypothetical protein
MMVMPENKFGYLSLSLTNGEETAGVLVSAKRIACILPGEDYGSHISFGGKDGIVVAETVDKILEQLENIHPSML